MENSSRAKLAALKQELRPLKYPWNSLEEEQILGGDCRGFFPLFRALIHAYWPSVGSRFVDTYEEQDMLGLAREVRASDPRTSIALVLGDLERKDVIVHKIYKFAREVLRMDIRLKENQFVSQVCFLFYLVKWTHILLFFLCLSFSLLLFEMMLHCTNDFRVSRETRLISWYSLSGQ